jgi:hypothetical protein
MAAVGPALRVLPVVLPPATWSRAAVAATPEYSATVSAPLPATVTVTVPALEFCR